MASVKAPKMRIECAMTRGLCHDRHGRRGEPDHFLAPPAHRPRENVHIALFLPRMFLPLDFPPDSWLYSTNI